MSSRSFLRAVCTAGALAVLVPVAEAQVAGGGVASGTDKLRVKKCGKGKSPAVLTFTLFVDGTWSAVDEENLGFSGTYVEASTRKVELAFDPASAALFEGVLASSASALCEQSVQVTSAVAKKFFLRRNTRRTKAKVRIKYAFTGMADGKSGTAKYVLKAGGPYSEAS